MVPLLFIAGVTVSDGGKCCVSCDASNGEQKYFSIAEDFDDSKLQCGETCIKPSQYNEFHFFEPNLEKAKTNTPCADNNFTSFVGTETHGGGPISCTLDMYKAPDGGGPVFEACPNLQQFRSESVVSSFETEKMGGFWYEVAYTDPAQVGASCQRANNSYVVTDGELQQNFQVHYGAVPFQQTYVYKPESTMGRGIFTKYLQGASELLELPTVIMSATGSDTDGNYEFMVEYTCKHVSLVTAIELRFMARTPTVSADVLAQMKGGAATGLGLLAKGHQSTLTSVTIVDASACGYSCDDCVSGAWDEPRAWCWKDQQCHEVGSLFNPCSSSQCVSKVGVTQCECSSCSDASCASTAGSTTKVSSPSGGADGSNTATALTVSFALLATAGGVALATNVYKKRMAHQKDEAESGYQLQTDTDADDRTSLAAL